jgi:predicted nucleic acid-binding Zn ribbon protein
MNNELIELVEQLIEFGYGDSPRLDSILNRLSNDESPYPSDQIYVDMLISKYLYPYIEEDESLKQPIGSLEKKIQKAKQQYGGNSTQSRVENISDLCPKCGSPVPRMFSFCSKCGAFHDEHNFVDVRKAKQKKEKLAHSLQQLSQDKTPVKESTESSYKEKRRKKLDKSTKKSRKTLKIFLIIFGILLVLVIGFCIWYISYLHDILSNATSMNFPGFDKYNIFNPNNFQYYDSLIHELAKGCNPVIVNGVITCN